MMTLMPDADMTLAHDLGITDLRPEAQESLLSGFAEVAVKAATAAILERLSEPKQEEFLTFAEKGDAVALKTFLDAEVPGHETIAGAAVREEFTRFKKALVA